MRIVIQRVSSASVTVENDIVGQIAKGFVVLVGVGEEDTEKDAEWLAQKVFNLRVFSDENGMMNWSLPQVNGDVLSISQFTLLASYKKGNRPSFIIAAKPEQAKKLYEYFNAQLAALLGKPVQAGVFGADMKVALINDGPVTIVMDSRSAE